jgi:hypothetical protein
VSFRGRAAQRRKIKRGWVLGEKIIKPVISLEIMDLPVKHRAGDAPREP